ncbi:MAG: 50S ribosomal protein L6 [Candidatus Micrarchaeia archaeon]
MFTDSMEVKVDGNKIIVNGNLGSVEKEFDPRIVRIEVKDGKVEVIPLVKNKKKAKMIKNTYLSLIKQMEEGVTKGYEQIMEVVFSHFPISLEVKGDKLIIKNLYGERIPREAKIVGKTKIEIKGKNLRVYGIDKYEVFQTVANIMQACKQNKFDPRVFQDGIYPVEK